MTDVHNPLLPTGYDVTWSMLTAVAIALTVLALILLARSARRLTPSQGLLWTLVVLLVPVLGPIAWLTIGRRTAPADENG
ncbi:PLDc N-terminal domain-containing protein [Microbacterium timonense]|uniref:PLDc N-terminal domain-containing protein n=1 Tax=Microbacterium timonense TaxID=2086576 RepID=UPI000D0FFE23|nr:PLDc N-terminal domain-containing protein [Microbacterium timonense]